MIPEYGFLIITEFGGEAGEEVAVVAAAAGARES
jgi:hypothetical protein